MDRGVAMIPLLERGHTQDWQMDIVHIDTDTSCFAVPCAAP